MKTLEIISNCTNTDKEHYLLATMSCREALWFQVVSSFVASSSFKLFWVLQALSFAVG